MIAFYIPGPPVPWKRARSNGARRYTDPKMGAYQAHIRGSAKTDGALPDKPITSPLAVSLDVAIGIPKSWSKQKQMQALTGALLPTSTPDLDNLQKQIGDALNGHLWGDDAQIVNWQASKRYGLAPGVWVRVEVV